MALKTPHDIHPKYSCHRYKLERRRKLGIFTDIFWILSWIILLSFIPLFRHVMIKSCIKFIPKSNMNIDFRYENVIQYGHPGKRYPNTIQEDDFEKIFNKTMVSPFGFEERWAPPSTIFVNWPMEVIDKPVILEDFAVSVERPNTDEL